ncbi:hypothetical protein C2W62_27790 [Candidatus Entotheonella serta]|nr:hypothetical protein C2W62_27790 [Candidatus Entotheonella serta]
MDMLRPIHWHEGMLLRPQHFQQQDRYHEAHVQHYAHMLSPFCWGLKSVILNEDALRDFRCQIERCEMITFDGTLIR